MSIQSDQFNINTCQFIISNENSTDGRVKISRQNLLALAAPRVSLNT